MIDIKNMNSHKNKVRK
jgi:hypothetical protein